MADVEFPCSCLLFWGKTRGHAGVCFVVEASRDAKLRFVRWALGLLVPRWSGRHGLLRATTGRPGTWLRRSADPALPCHQVAAGTSSQMCRRIWRGE